MTSNSGAMRITSSNMAMWCARWSTEFLLSRREVFDPVMSLAEVCESPLANKVTSWPCATSSSVRNETTRSVPPYILGGTLSYRGKLGQFLLGPRVGQTTPISTASVNFLVVREYPVNTVEQIN